MARCFLGVLMAALIAPASAFPVNAAEKTVYQCVLYGGFVFSSNHPIKGKYCSELPSAPSELENPDVSRGDEIKPRPGIADAAATAKVTKTSRRKPVPGE